MPLCSSKPVLPLGACLLLFASACSENNMEVPTPTLDAGVKTDVIDHVEIRGSIAVGESVVDEFSEDLEFHGYTIDLLANTEVQIEITQKETLRSLDTTLFVYGPQQGTDGGVAGYGTSAIAFDNDSGWGRHARITPFAAPQSGQYLIVVGTVDGRGRGNYRLAVDCLSADCTGAPVQTECALSPSYSAIYWGRSPTVHLLSQVDIDSPSAVTPLQESQILSAMEASSVGSDISLQEAFQAVDQSYFVFSELHDISTRSNFTAIEYALGDTVMGRIFEYGTARMVAEIEDRDLYECSVAAGPEGKDCADTSDCASGLECVGITTELNGGTGRCIDLSADNHPQTGDHCGRLPSQACPEAAGLLCMGLTQGSEGTCLPAWMRSLFIHSGPEAIEGGALSSTEVAYGLASVSMDVEIEANLTGVGPGHVRVTLTSPSGTEVLLVDDHIESSVRLNQPVQGFSKNEDVNGAWTLEVETDPNLPDPTLTSWTLKLGSSWN